MVYHPQGQDFAPLNWSFSASRGDCHGCHGILFRQAVVAEHYGLAPSARGYRFGNHPMTRGPVRRRDTDHGHDESWMDPMDPNRI